jgi:hypothetical protein
MLMWRFNRKDCARVEARRGIPRRDWRCLEKPGADIHLVTAAKSRTDPSRGRAARPAPLGGAQAGYRRDVAALADTAAPGLG